jgi:hypothetical protein
MLFGIKPVKLLCDKSKTQSLLIFRIIGQIGPSKLLSRAESIDRVIDQ